LKKLVLFIEWSTKGRDFEIDLPLIYFFEKYLNWDVKYISLFNIPAILRLRPDIVIMSNTTGAYENFYISKLIATSGIPLFSHVSEGMFRPEHLDNALWGWNSEKYFYEKHLMLWSYSTYCMSIQKYPNLKNKLRVSGSIGHDKYKIFSHINIFANQLQQNKYKMIVGYACFDFHNIIKNRERYSNLQSKERIDYIINSIVTIKNLLFNLIKENPNILFVAKAHPGDGNILPKEIEGLLKFKNFMLVNDSIIDIIGSVNIWMSFNSSTNLEAWLFDKPTIVFATNNLIRSSKVVEGSIRENKFEKIQQYFNEYMETEKIENFNKKDNLRKELISDLIGFEDGLNHIRFMSFLRKYIEKEQKNDIISWNITLKERILFFFKHLLYKLARGKYKIPFIKKYAYIYDNFDLEEYNLQKKKRFQDLDLFYQINSVKIKEIYFNWYKNAH